MQGGKHFWLEAFIYNFTKKQISKKRSNSKSRLSQTVDTVKSVNNSYREVKNDKNNQQSQPTPGENFYRGQGKY